MNYKPLNTIVIILLLLVISLILFKIIPVWILIASIICYFFFLLLISTNVQWNFFVKAKNNNSSNSCREIALTFDDGPVKSTLEILALLKKFNMKASFFCIGKNIQQNPEIFKKIINEGHMVGNHTFSHTRKMGFLTTKQITKEIESCNRVAFEVGEVKLKTYRPPFGVINPKVKRALEITQHQVIGWNIRSYDAVLNSEKYILKRITRKLKSGDVILLHDNNLQTIKILEQLLLFLQTNDYRSVRVDNLFQIDAYT